MAPPIISSTVIKLKRSESADAIPVAGSLQVGELALNLVDKKVYTKNSAGTVIQIAGASDTLSDIMARGNSSPTALVLTNVTASTSKTTGALTVTGGVGVNGKLNAGSIGVNNVYTLPTVDGSNTYVMSTDGAGNLSWIPNGSGFASITSPSQTTLSASTSSTLNFVGGSGIAISLDSILNRVTITNTGLETGSFITSDDLDVILNTESFPTGDYGDVSVFSATIDAFGVAINSIKDYDFQGYPGYLRTVDFGTL